MQRCSINIKKVIITLYVIIPSIFYLFFYLFSLTYGDLPVYFFGKMILTPYNLLSFFAIHFFIGLTLVLILKQTKYNITYRSHKNMIYDISIIFMYSFTVFTSIPYLNDIIFMIFIISIASYRPSKYTFISLFIIALLEMYITKERGSIVLILILFFLPYLSRLNYKQLICFSVAAAFSMIYILQPLKGGSIPFTNDYFNLGYSIKHMYPILIGAAASAKANVDAVNIFVESIPLLKGILHQESIIDTIAYNSLSMEAIENGTRLGSNSTLFLNHNGFLVLIVLFFLIYILMTILKSKILYNSTLLFFVIYGPYFIRRFFGSYVLDFILMSFIIFFIYINLFIFRKLEIIKRKKNV